jgi:purine-nucleoside phosphorylase
MATGKQAIKEAAEFVQSRIAIKPRVGIVLGSGLMQLAATLDLPRRLTYAAIPHFPLSHVQGHQGALYVGHLGEPTVACLAGRVHGYEGYTPEQVVFGVRLLANLGCKVVILTNAAGSVTPNLPAGSLMLITDHLNLTGSNPLIGWYGDTPQFVDMTDAYDRNLRDLAVDCAVRLGLDLKMGVYAGLGGPSYETSAEVCMLSHLGASAVGMSTVHETIALRDLGVRVLGLSCITNAGAGIEGSVLNHEHVQVVAQNSHRSLANLVANIIERIAEQF